MNVDENKVMFPFPFGMCLSYIYLIKLHKSDVVAQRFFWPIKISVGEDKVLRIQVSSGRKLGIYDFFF